MKCHFDILINYLLEDTAFVSPEYYNSPEQQALRTAREGELQTAASQELSDKIDDIWNWLGFIPFGVGSAFDAAHSLKYFATSHPILGFFSILAAVPGIGDAAALVKISKGGAKVIERSLLTGALDKILTSIVGKKQYIIPQIEKLFSEAGYLPAYNKYVKNSLEYVFNEIEKYIKKPINAKMQYIIRRGGNVLAKDIGTNVGMIGGIEAAPYALPAVNKTIAKVTGEVP